MRGNRWVLLSIVFAVGGFALAWKYADPGSFATIAGAALLGGHATNVAERMRSQNTARPPPDQGEGP